jgi:hypothetical protein
VNTSRVSNETSADTRTWHAFNWNNEYRTAPTKRELLDSMGCDKPKVRRQRAGEYEVTVSHGRMWFVYSDLEKARSNGFEVPQ